MNEEARYERDPNLVMRRIGGETILVPVRGRVGDLEAIYTLDEVGSTLWTLLAERPTLPEMVNALCAEYDVSPETARVDVDEFLKTLVSGGLAHRRAG